MQGQTVHKLHGNVGLAQYLANFVDLADVFMIDAGLGAGLLQEALHSAVVLGMQELDCDEALQAQVAGPIYGAHATPPEQGQ